MKIQTLLVTTVLFIGLTAALAAPSLTIRLASAETSDWNELSSASTMTGEVNARTGSVRTLPRVIDPPLPWDARWQSKSTRQSDGSITSDESSSDEGPNNVVSLWVAVETAVEVTANPTLLGWRYQLLYADEITGPWQTLGEPIVADDFTITWTDTATTPMRFYQLQEIRPLKAPVVAITSPSSGITVSGYDVLQIQATATATETGKHVVHAVLFNNSKHKVGDMVGDDLGNLTFQISPKFMHPGTHTFQVMVSDNSEPTQDGAGNVGWSEPISINFDNPFWFTTIPGDCYFCNPDWELESGNDENWWRPSSHLL